MIDQGGTNGVLQKQSCPKNDPNTITPSRLQALADSQNYKCALTGRDLTPDCASIDHKLPLSRGGTNTLDNVHVVFRDVNAAKGTMTLEEFVEMCREVVRHAESCQTIDTQGARINTTNDGQSTPSEN